MIIVKLYGGLGNQMFQYAAAKALSVRNKIPLKLDISHFDKSIPNQTTRRYNLNIFPNIKEEIANRNEIKKHIPKFKSAVLNKVYKNINKRLLNFNSYYKIEKDLSYSGIALNSHKAVYLEGYWQSEKYFEKESHLIKECFSLDHLYDENSIQPFLKMIQSGISVSVHVRRGDYVTNPSINSYHGVLDISYYQQSIAKIAGLISANLTVFIFSDDIEWCKENIKIPYKHVYISTGKDHYDLYLMSSCRHNVIANSSFSWWAAWLNKNSDKIIIAPKKWFYDQSSKDVIPVNWITE